MVTVSDVVGSKELDLTAVIMSRPNLVVGWVATSELADPTPFLEGGEVLLTTGLNTVDWADEWDGYVRRIVGADVVAVGFGTGLTHESIPAGLERACREHDVNLFEVPRRTRFVTISRLIAHKVGEPEQAAAREALVMQRELTQAALRRDDSAALLSRLADIVGGVCVVSTHGESSEARGEDIPPSLEPDRLRHEIERLRPQGLRAASTTSDPSGVTIIQPLGLRGRPHSYLAVWSPGRLNDGQRSAITTAVALLGLAAEHRRDRRETVWRLRRRAMELIVARDERAAAIVLAAITGGSPAQVRLPEPVRAVRAAGPADLLDDGGWAVEDAGDDPGAVLAARVDDQLWLLAEPGHATDVATRLASQGLRVGVGRVVPRAEAGRSLDGAGQALVQAGDATAVRWEQLADDGVLALLDHERGAAFADSFLGRLAGARTDPDALLATLESFLRHHGRHGAVAAELGIHRNTVRHRITEIESALGRSLDDPQVRVDAWIALTFRH